MKNLEDENARLKAENERLTESRDRQVEINHELDDLCTSLKTEVKRLNVEVDILRASSFVTAVSVEQYERVVKAGDAVALDYAERIEIEAGETAKTLMKTLPVLREWNAAKEGKPSV